MMNFSIKQIYKIIEIIEKNQAVFIGSKLGLEYLSPSQRRLLKKNGIDLTKFKGKMSEIDMSFYFGMMAQAMGGLKSFKVTKKNFQSFFRKKVNQPNNKQRKAQLEYIKKRAAIDINGLGNKVTGVLQQSILTASVADRNKRRKAIKEKSVEAIDRNWTAQQLASELRHATGDWARDFSRIADFILQESYGFGRAQQIIEDFGEDAMVYKQTFPGVCKPCKDNYGLPGMEPVVYKLSDLLDNGNNIGRKDQLPVAGNAHPWARSILHHIPENSKWDASKKKFVIQRDTHGVKRKSKVKVKITP